MPNNDHVQDLVKRLGSHAETLRNPFALSRHDDRKAAPVLADICIALVYLIGRNP